MEKAVKYAWENIIDVPSQNYKCGYCGSSLASAVGYKAIYNWSGRAYAAYIYICHFCTRPTFFEFDEQQVPDVAFGNDVKDIDDISIHELYSEARRATGANCYTAAVLCCRKLLMHIAVSKGAKENDSFASYVDYLSEKNYVPPDAKAWVDHIRKKGNEANHEINIIKKEDAEELLSFIEMLLKLIYEFPATVRKKYSKPTEEST